MEIANIGNISVRAKLRHLVIAAHSQIDGNWLWTCDEDGNGRISMDDMSTVAARLGLPLSGEMQKYLIDHHSGAGKRDEGVDYEELLLTLHGEASQVQRAIAEWSNQLTITVAAPHSTFETLLVQDVSHSIVSTPRPRSKAPVTSSSDDIDALLLHLAAQGVKPELFDEVLQEIHAPYHTAAPDSTGLLQPDTDAVAPLPAAVLQVSLNSYSTLRIQMRTPPLFFRRVDIAPPAGAPTALLGAWAPTLGTAYEYIGGRIARLNNRGPNVLAIVTHPLDTGAAARLGCSDHDRVCRRPLHRHLANEGFSVLAYPAAPGASASNENAGGGSGNINGDGAHAAAQLRAAMRYIRQHRIFKYAKVVVLAAGAGASAAIRAVHEAPDDFEMVLRCISACQPAAFADADATRELLSTWVPRLPVPVLVSCAKFSGHVAITSSAKNSSGKHNRRRSMTNAEMQDMYSDTSAITGKSEAAGFARLLHSKIPSHLQRSAINREILWVPRGFPLYGPQKVFHGSAYFGQHPERLCKFLRFNTEPQSRNGKQPALLILKRFRAHGLPNADSTGGINGLSDPFLRFTIVIEGKSVGFGELPPIQNVLNPIWPEQLELVFQMPALWSKATIHVEVLDDDVSSDDDLMGVGDALITNHLGKAHGKMHKVLLRGADGFEDSHASFDYEYAEVDPLARNLWNRLRDVTSGVVAAAGTLVPGAMAAAANSVVKTTPRKSNK